jgi:hypothetical protein
MSKDAVRIRSILVVAALLALPATADAGIIVFASPVCELASESFVPDRVTVSSMAPAGRSDDVQFQSPDDDDQMFEGASNDSRGMTGNGGELPTFAGVAMLPQKNPTAFAELLVRVELRGVQVHSEFIPFGVFRPPRQAPSHFLDSSRNLDSYINCVESEPT